MIRGMQKLQSMQKIMNADMEYIKLLNVHQIGNSFIFKIHLILFMSYYRHDHPDNYYLVVVVTFTNVRVDHVPTCNMNLSIAPEFQKDRIQAYQRFVLWGSSKINIQGGDREYTTSTVDRHTTSVHACALANAAQARSACKLHPHF